MPGFVAGCLGQFLYRQSTVPGAAFGGTVTVKYCRSEETAEQHT